jgi:hypothetical protein
MFLRNLTWSALLWQSILALSVPQDNAQIPMRTEQQTTKPTSNTVILAFTSGGSNRVQHAEISVHQQIHSGMSHGVSIVYILTYASHRYRPTSTSGHDEDRDNVERQGRICIFKRIESSHVPSHTKIKRGRESSLESKRHREGVAVV